MAVGRPGVPSWVDTAGDERRPQSDAGERAGAEDWASTGPVGGSSRLQATLSRGLAYTLWGLVAAAVVLGLVNCAGAVPGGSSPPQAQPPAADPVPPPGGCPELVVASWLAGETELLGEVPGMPRAQPEPGRRQASRTYTAGVTPGEQAWGYLIGADVEVWTEPDEQDPAAPAQWRPAGTQFFMVTMIPGEGGCHGWHPAALPAQVPAPALAADASVAYPAALAASGTELAETLEAFFNGLLAGTENLERYVAPGVTIPALVPPPYQQVSLTELRAQVDVPAQVPPDGTVVQLLTTVTADADDLPLVYPVTVGVRGGRWEVVGIDPLVGAAALDPGADPGTELDSSPPAERTNGG